MVVPKESTLSTKIMIRKLKKKVITTKNQYIDKQTSNNLKKIVMHQNNPGPNLFYLCMCELGKSLINFHPKTSSLLFSF